ncbi:hypothetical protein RBU49_09105 [Clostridium sp. MB40-C1]|uniref:hypothetical protein n=1 Tax=Clostridium sp. MB40-C1 TaxID=3070996 RepID=UPI0027E18F15|nr:hypothetical protein [Clostridium sp. MB40-C1]WMJ82387.1 hypothetical protein RBU49_09105 [Clostridium sp. MB40-C1]
MAAFFKAFLPMLALVIITIFIYNVLKIYVLENIKVNKWIPLAAALVVLFVPQLIGYNLRNTYLYYVQTCIFLIFFLWFMDIIGFTKSSSSNRNKNDKNSTIIRSKAKPERLNKNKDIEVINNKKKKKKK